MNLRPLLRTLRLQRPAVAESLSPQPPVEAKRRLPPREEWFPFTVEVVSSMKALRAAVKVRQAAYSRHLPEFADSLLHAEPSDMAPGTTLLLARSKLDGSPMGSMRIQNNALRPLPLEASLELPEELRQAHLAEASRLGVTLGESGRLVKAALFKAMYLYALQQDVEYLVVTARAPIDRQYQRLLFSEVYPGLGMVPLKHVANLPHRIMKFELLTAEKRWADARHPMLDFMCNTLHPDIHIAQNR